MTQTTHDLQTENLRQEYQGDGPDPEPETAAHTNESEESAKQDLAELIGMIRAHLTFQADCLSFTRQSLKALSEAVRETLG